MFWFPMTQIYILAISKSVYSGYLKIRDSPFKKATFSSSVVKPCSLVKNLPLVNFI